LKLEFFLDVVTCCCILHNMFHEGRDLDIEALMDSIDEELLENTRPYVLPLVLGGDLEREQWNFMLHHSSRDGSGEAKRSLLKAFSADQPPLPKRARNSNADEEGNVGNVHAEADLLSTESEDSSIEDSNSKQDCDDHSAGDNILEDDEGSEGTDGDNEY
jgi:hypothetical protein